MALYTKPEPGMPVLFNVGERILELRYPLRTLKELQTQGIVLLRGEGLAGAFSDPTTLSNLLFQGLRTKQPDLTQDWVDDNIDASILVGLAPLIAYALSGQWVQPGQRTETEKNGQTVQTG